MIQQAAPVEDLDVALAQGAVVDAVGLQMAVLLAGPERLDGGIVEQRPGDAETDRRTCR